MPKYNQQAPKNSVKAMVLATPTVVAEINEFPTASLPTCLGPEELEVVTGAPEIDNNPPV